MGEQRYDVEADQAGADYSIDQFLTLPVAGGTGNPTATEGEIPLGTGLEND